MQIKDCAVRQEHIFTGEQSELQLLLEMKLYLLSSVSFIELISKQHYLVT